MTRTDQLSEYIRAGLSAGRSADALAHALVEAGWSTREVSAALSAWMPAPAGLPPVPRPRPYVSALEAVIYGLLFLLLGVICWHIAALGFEVIDALLPEPGGSFEMSRTSVRWSVATLIPTVPLFLWLSGRVVRGSHPDTGRRRSVVRKWFASVTLLIVSLALLSDVVAVVFALLNGDLTARFVAKAVLIAAIGGAVFAYYRGEFDAD